MTSETETDPLVVLVPRDPAFADRTRAPQPQQGQENDPSVPSTTTFQQDLTMAGQRRINLIWEYTQSVIALFVVVANMVVGTYQGLSTTPIPFPTILSSSLFLIVGFYFSRTNHAAIGGVGTKPSMGAYQGR